MVNQANDSLRPLEQESSILKLFEEIKNPNDKKVKKLAIKKCENNLKVEGSEIVKAIDDAAKEGLILEMEYILPSTPYRIKSVYFPADTKLTLKGKELWNKQL